MANPIVQQINAELTELQKELANFKNTVDYLNSAKIAVKDAVVKVNHSEAHFNKKVEELKSTYNTIIDLSESVSSVMKKLDTINFPERLDNIEKTVRQTIVSLDETKKQTIGEVQKASEAIIKADFDKKFKELRDVVNEAVKSSDKLSSTIENQQLGEKVTEVEKGVSKRIQESYNEIEKNRLSDLSTLETIESHVIANNKFLAKFQDYTLPDLDEKITFLNNEFNDQFSKFNKSLSRIDTTIKSLEVLIIKGIYYEKIRFYILLAIILIIGLFLKFK